jgi:DNA processing protein
MGLNRLNGLGPVRIRQLLQTFPSAEHIWQASIQELIHAGLSSRNAEELAAQRSRIDLSEDLKRLEKSGAEVITILDERYPALLAELPDAPFALYALGDPGCLLLKSIAIVGTRKPSKYGHDVAYSLSWHLASHGVTVVSGMAKGIDAAAHRGALAGGGYTVAVLGSGIDHLYPRHRDGLASRIAQSGAIVTEFPLGTPPVAGNFPRRNRIISGLSLGVLIAEAPEKSGALITADAAADQGREVFAVPTSIFNVTGRGNNALLQDGAKLVMRVSDVLVELDVAYSTKSTQTVTEGIVPESPEERALLRALGADPIHIDDLVRLTQLSASVVTSTLTILELKNAVVMTGNMQYCLAIHTSDL